jgi:hypothetical protein
LKSVSGWDAFLMGKKLTGWYSSVARLAQPYKKDNRANALIGNRQAK